MSLLAPLYFAGALAIGLPILFHLIRRQPKGQVEFSSLMFLRPTPPRLTRRSRLDNWPLLLMRALALILLALAFARPFLRSVALSDAEIPGRRLVLLVDTSASMQRTGLWQQALDKADDVISDLQPADRLAIVTFDRRPRTLLGFEQSAQLAPENLKTTARSLLREVGPTWHATEIGKAISFAGDLAVTYENEGEDQNAEADASGSDLRGSTGPAHMILISDMQAGSHLEQLQVYAWPKELKLDVDRVAPVQRTNASAQVLPITPESGEDADRVRVRVANTADASESRFRIRWAGGNRQLGSRDAAQNELPVQVPPGQSRVVRMPAPAPGVTSLLLQGDDHSFDNTRFIVSPEPQELSLVHVGDQSADPRDSLFYYLQRVPLSNYRRNVSIESVKTLAQVPDPKKTPLIVVEKGLEDGVAARLKEYVSKGGRLLVVFTNQGTDATASGDALAATVNRIADSSLNVREAEVDDYVMFSRIDFGHPLFEPMSDPQFNDFSKIRFWSHRSLVGVDDSWQVVAQFDDGDPAIVETKLDEGRLFVLTAGWQPQSSQLALSTKFIPIVFSLFDSGRRASGSDSYSLGEPIDFEPSETATITGPSGSAFEYRTAQDADGIDQPGIYVFQDGDQSRTFAVNLDDLESRTEAINEDELERFGVILGKNITTEQARENQRQLRDRELEGQQRLWQWLIVAALGLLGLETFLGMLWSRRETVNSGQLTVES